MAQTLAKFQHFSVAVLALVAFLFHFCNAGVLQVYAGLLHTCAILNDTSVKCWGAGISGILGYGDTISRGDRPFQMGANLPIVNLGSGRTAVGIATGDSHTCALLDDSSVKCWGFGATGSLGYGNGNTRGNEPGEMGDNLPEVDLGTGKTAVQIAAGNSHTCAVLDDASVKCWGAGGSGRLGYGDNRNRGDDSGEMGNLLPAIQLGAARTVVQISTGDSHTCAILDTAAVKCWGAGFNAQLGYGDGDSRGNAPTEMGDALPTVNLGAGRTAVQIDTGNIHTCVLLDDSSVKCWGAGGKGRLGYGNTTSRGDDPGEMGDSLPAVDLGAEQTAVQVSAGGEHTCVLLANASVKCWGAGSDGQLGYGDQNNRGDEPNEMGDNLPIVDLGSGRTAVQIVAGDFHTCALLDDTTIKCWGANGGGRLGYGDFVNRGDNPGEMGDNLPHVDLFNVSSPDDSSPLDPTLIGSIIAGVVALLAAVGFVYEALRKGDDGIAAGEKKLGIEL